MFSATAYDIRPARPDDARILTVLAELDSQRVPNGRVLIGSIGGQPVAAIDIDTDRVIADPFRATGNLSAHLRMRAAGYRAAKREPSVRERIAGALRPALAPAHA